MSGGCGNLGSPENETFSYRTLDAALFCIVLLARSWFGWGKRAVKRYLILGKYEEAKKNHHLISKNGYFTQFLATVTKWLKYAGVV